jgi:hypothetical protein
METEMVGRVPMLGMNLPHLTGPWIIAHFGQGLLIGFRRRDLAPQQTIQSVDRVFLQRTGRWGRPMG